MSSLILPGDHRYSETLANIPFFWNSNRDLLPSEGGALIYDSDTNLPRVANWGEMQEYLYDGEYDIRMQEIDAEDEAEEEFNDYCEPLASDYEITDADLKANWEFLKCLG